jgi:hypothetical protein
MSQRIGAKKTYKPLAEMSELANMLRTDEGQDHLLAFTAEDCERFGIPGPWFFSRVNATPYAHAVNVALRQLAELKVPEAGSELSISLNLPLPPLEAVVREDGILTQRNDFFRDKFLAALFGRDIDIGRIRICEICGSIFIALRVDASACRGKCANVNNARRFRNPEARKRYRENRKQNIKAKASRKQGKHYNAGFHAASRNSPLLVNSSLLVSKKTQAVGRMRRSAGEASVRAQSDRADVDEVP